MSAKRSLARRKQAASSGILLRYRDKDTAEGVTRKTLPGYAADNGPVMPKQVNEIRRLVPQRGFVSSKKRLF